VSLENLLLGDAALAPYLTDTPSRSLTDAVRALIAQQLENWPELQQARALLEQAVFRNLRLNDLAITLQCNPGRIVSARSPVDKESIRRRPCFLCLNNLPPEQRGLLYRDEWLILNNPAPLFPDHLVISHTDHCLQRIEPALPAMISLTRELDFSFIAFYNGPACGASAPDHLHFQMAPAGAIPLVEQIKRLLEKNSGSPVLQKVEESPQGTCFFGYPDFRSVFICKTQSPDFLQDRFSRALCSLPAACAGEEEAMVNVIIAGSSGTYYGILFPRKEHRPTCYFKEDPEKMVISPGAVDVGGLLILPRREDFDRLDRETILGIFREVCQGPEVFSGLAIRGS
jgi:hypothetical protein